MRRLSLAEFVLAHTTLRAVPSLPGVQLHLADDSIELWETTQVAVDRGELPPPFWAFAWAGGVALARHVLESPETVQGRRVLDAACGSGVVSIAAALAGASHVRAVDVDELAIAATRLNARANGVTVDAICADVTHLSYEDVDVVLAGDVFYDTSIAQQMSYAFARARAAGAEVLVGDPRRTYLPDADLEVVAAYDVTVDPDLENTTLKACVVARLR